MKLTIDMKMSNENIEQETELEVKHLLEQKYEFEREIRTANKANKELEDFTEKFDKEIRSGAGLYAPCMDIEELENFLGIGMKILDLKEEIDRGSAAEAGLRETNKQLQTRYTLLSGLAMEEI